MRATKIAALSLAVIVLILTIAWIFYVSVGAD